jgi:transposase InsO family protein
MYSTLMVELKASAAALSRAGPTRPIDCKTPSRRQAVSNVSAVYTAQTFRQACRRLGIRQSMGRPGSALDNAAIEAWHSSLEFELRSREFFATKAIARTRVAAWIDEYNRERRHSALGMQSPIAYELAHARTEAA